MLIYFKEEREQKRFLALAKRLFKVKITLYWGKSDTTQDYFVCDHAFRFTTSEYSRACLKTAQTTEDVPYYKDGEWYPRTLSWGAGYLQHNPIII